MFARRAKGLRQSAALVNAGFRFRPIAIVVSAAFALGNNIAVAAGTRPFDNGGSDALNDGVVLTRYALGITGSPLVASTRYASLDPLQVKNNIECVGCALDMNGDGQIDTVDTTIIARHLAGFSGAALTNGLALGSGSRNTEAAVTSFLANGCGVSRDIAGYEADRFVFRVANLANTTSAYSTAISAKSNGTGIWGDGVIIGVYGYSDTGWGVYGINNSGGASGAYGGGYRGGKGVEGYTAGGGDAIYGYAKDGGRGVFGYSTTGIGVSAEGPIAVKGVSTGGVGSAGVVGEAKGSGTGVVGRADSTSPATSYGVYSVGKMGVSESGSLDFGSKTRQVLNLYGDGTYGIGIQPGTMYFRMDDTVSQFRDYGFSWYRGGSHVDENNKPGPGGVELMRLNSNKGDLYVRGSVIANVTLNSSDRNLKTLIQNINPSSILEKVAALPISKWIYKTDEAKNWHIGPMAQDFREAFGLGLDDKTIATVDADGIALAAIQGLNAKVVEQGKTIKAKDAEITLLRQAQDVLKAKLALIEKKLGM
jgi:Chaperone of endosialidase